MLTLGELMASAEVMDKVITLPVLARVVLSELLEAMVTLSSVGGVVAIVKELTERLSLVLLALSVTEILQLLWVPSARASKVIGLLPALALSGDPLQTL